MRRTSPSTLAACLLVAACATPRPGPPEGSAPDPGPEPAAGVLIVLDKGAATAEWLDLESGEIVRRLKTGEGPHEGVVTPDGRFAIVANYGGPESGNTLTVIDLVRGVTRAPIDLGEYVRPHGLAFAGDLLLVTSEAKRMLLGVDVASGKIVHTGPTAAEVSHMVAAAPDGSRAFVANIGSGSISVIDLSTWTTIATVKTGAQAEGVDVSPDGSRVWVTNRQDGTVTVIDAASLSVLAQIDCPGFPIRVKHTPDGALALVSCPSDSDVKVFDTRTFERKADVKMEFDLAGGAEEGLFGTRFGNSAQPIGVLIPPHGRVAYVACAAADRVAVIDLATLTVRESFAVGREPDGLAWFEPRKEALAQ